MITFLSLVTSVKDYVEITHKLIESNPSFSVNDYTEFGSLFTYLILSVKTFLTEFISFSWLKSIWSLPVIVPDIASAMVSEISVLDGYFHNAFTFLENGALSLNNTVQSLPFNGEALNSLDASGSNLKTIISEGNKMTNNSYNIVGYGFEKFLIGFINSLFLCLPTATPHLITIRRFAMQGLEAGYIAGLGTIAGNFLWLASIILGWRFFVIPWVSFDIFRYILGFILLVKYLWDSSKERRMVLEDLSKWKIFLLNFLLALTEQTSVYPFISNLSIGPEASILEGFPVDNYSQFIVIHGFYLAGILIGSLTLLQFTCWFWENPAFSIYMWITTKAPYGLTTGNYYKILNFTFMYLTILCAISSIPYFGLDYTITNPLGLIPQDRIIEQKPSSLFKSENDKLIRETSFLNIRPTDKNMRVKDGVHARRERWKERLIKYQAFDASVYDQGVYDILTIEDLNYGFDRFWLRRKMRNHQIRFRLFPGPWMRSLKKQLNKPGFTGPRVEFFRILFEQYYHPNFHSVSADYVNNKVNNKNKLMVAAPNLPGIREKGGGLDTTFTKSNPVAENIQTIKKSEVDYATLKGSFTFKLKNGLIQQYSALRKFSRNLNSRTKIGKMTTIDSSGISRNVGLSRMLKPFEKGSPLLNEQVYYKTPSTLRTFKRFKGFILSAKHLTLKATQDSQINNNNSVKWEKHSLLNTSFSAKKQTNLFRNISQKLLFPNSFLAAKTNTLFKNAQQPQLKPVFKNLSKKEKQLLSYKTNLAISSGSLVSSFQNSTFLHPLNFYLQKEQAFKRKLKYYGNVLVRKLSVGNNASYFRTMMKRSFYYHKPSLRWRKTLFVASMRRGFRKKSRKPAILSNLSITDKEMQSASLNEQSGLQSFNTNLKIGSEGSAPIWPLSREGNATVTNNKISPFIPDKEGNKSQMLFPKTERDNAALIKKPTHSYSVLGKRASRYRYQIYKDVLQHWYYTPFNRLLLKFDIDAFMNRQPKSHFLTKKEEHLLHLRRFLLCEHYDTLRWYTYMQHYRTMKMNIGGTKSFSSRVYNQQFQGTFKKIRHLFAITPSQNSIENLDFSPLSDILTGQSPSSGEKDVLNTTKQKPYNVGKEPVETFILKFDQPLYNETYTKNNKGSWIHEELLPLNTDPVELVPSSKRVVPDNSVVAATPPQENLKEKEKESLSAASSSVELNKQEQSPFSSLFSSLSKCKALSEAKAANPPKNLKGGVTEGRAATTLNAWSEGALSNRANREEALKVPFTDLIGESSNILGNYISNEKGIKEKVIKKLLTDKNYAELTAMLVNSSGYSPTFSEAKSVKNSFNKAENKADSSLAFVDSGEIGAMDTELWFKLLKECKRRLNDQTFLKNYISHRIEKREQRNKEKEKELDKRVQYLENWLVAEQGKSETAIQSTTSQFAASNNVTTGMEKALNDGIFVLNNLNPAFTSKPVLKSEAAKFKVKTSKRFLAKKEIKEKTEQEILYSLNSIKKALSQISLKPNVIRKSERLLLNSSKTVGFKESLFAAKKDLKNISGFSVKGQNIISHFWTPVKKAVFILKTVGLKNIKYLKAQKNKNLEWWRKKQRVITKRKSSRKKGRFKKQISEVKAKADYIQKLVNKPAIGAQNLENLQELKNIFKQPNAEYLQKVLTNEAERELAVNKYLFGNPYEISKFDLVKVNKNIKDLKTANIKNNTTLLGSQIDSLKTVKTEGRSDISNITLTELRKKTDSKNKEIFDKEANFVFKLKQIFIKKFRKKVSSKGPRYRNMSMSRNFAFIRRPTIPLEKEREDYIISKSSRDIATSPLAIVGDLNTQPNKFKLLGKNEIKKAARKMRGRKIWRKRKRQKFKNNHYKYRKRRIQGSGKLRVFNKKLKRIKSAHELQTWWWNSFLPNYYQKFFEKVKRNNTDQSLNNVTPFFKDFKEKEKEKESSVLDTPSNTTFTKDEKRFNLLSNKIAFSSGYLATKGEALEINNTIKNQNSKTSPLGDALSVPYNILDKIYENVLLDKDAGTPFSDAATNINDINLRNTTATGQNLKTNASVITSLPFYAGWDESLRKFVITNRFLSRRDAGFYTLNKENKDLNPVAGKTVSDTPLSVEGNRNMFQSPLQGLNEGSFLYWQTDMPFNAYNIDQLIPTNQSFYAPLGWRRFQFRHTILKNWLNLSLAPNVSKSSALINLKPFKAYNTTKPLLIKNVKPSALNQLESSTGVPFSFAERSALESFKLTLEYFNNSYNLSDNKENELLQLKNEKNYVINSPKGNVNSFKDLKESLRLDKIKNQQNLNRRIKKRYKLLKQMPIQLMYSPTGALLNDVLPSHYISVFDKQYRFPRSRYLKRHLPSAIMETRNDSPSLPVGVGEKDFTLRKRVKSRRKYHRKRYSKKDGLVFPRRTKFIVNLQSSETPISMQNNGVLNGSTVPNVNEEEFKTFETWRPSTLRNSKRGALIPSEEGKGVKGKQATKPQQFSKEKSKSRKRVKTNPLRLRQLRRREFQQILKPTQRYQPRYGGFTWPGDYLRLAIVEMPKLQSLDMDNYTQNKDASNMQPVKNKKIPTLKPKIDVQPVGILPRKYLIQKHNLKVLKKKIGLSIP